MRLTCAHCASGSTHPQFAVLLWSPDSSSWDYGRQPNFKLRCHNRERRFIRGQKSTKSGAPNHKNALIIGPFWGNASTFVHVMKANNRKFLNRMRRGIFLAQMWSLVETGHPKLRMWCPDEPSRKNVMRMIRGADDAKQMLHLANAARAAISKQAS